MKQTAKECAERGGLLQSTLGQLRLELGYGRLGRYILEEIAEALERAQLGYFPLSMLDPDFNTEPRQHHELWVYNRDGSTRARVLDAVLHPEKHDVRSILDGLAAGDLSALTADEKVDRIREIVSA